MYEHTSERKANLYISKFDSRTDRESLLNQSAN